MMEINPRILKRVPLFSTLTDADLREIRGACRRLLYPKGSIVFHEGDAADSLLIVLSGSVKVVLFGGRGQELIMSTIGPLGFMGDLSLLDGGNRSATVMALEPTECLSLPRAKFLKLVWSHQPVMRKILENLAAQLRDSTETARTLSMYTVHGRVLRALLKYAAKHGRRERGRIIIRPITHQFLADAIGASRETVSRTLDQLAQAGNVTQPRRGTLVIEAAALKRMGMPGL